MASVGSSTDKFFVSELHPDITDDLENNTSPRKVKGLKYSTNIIYLQYLRLEENMVLFVGVSI